MESMAATDKAQQELEQIERQVAEMESSDPDAATRRQIAVLQERIDTAKPGAGVGPGLHVHGFDQIYFELEGSMTLNYGISTYGVQDLHRL